MAQSRGRSPGRGAAQAPQYSARRPHGSGLRTAPAVAQRMPALPRRLLTLRATQSPHALGTLEATCPNLLPRACESTSTAAGFAPPVCPARRCPPLAPPLAAAAVLAAACEARVTEALACSDRSLFLNYVTNPIYNRLVCLFPLWLAPNLITLLGACSCARSAELCARTTPYCA
jgi:hypothetical protein